LPIETIILKINALITQRQQFFKKYLQKSTKSTYKQTDHKLDYT